MGFNPLRWPGQGFRWIGKFAFGFVCDRCFEKVDIDRSGLLEAAEVELAILYLYNMVNKRLPGWQDPPTREAIQAAIKSYDKDGNMKLDREEFKEFVKSLMATGPDVFFARIGRNMVATSAVLPGAAYAVKSVAGGPVKDVPLALLAPLLGTVAKSIRGLLPF